MKKFIGIALVLSLLVPAAFAQSPALVTDPSAQQQSGMTKDQEKKLEALVKDNVKKTKPMFDEMKKIADAIEKEFLKDKPSTVTLSKHNDKMADIQKKMGLERINYLMKLKEIVGKENFKQMIEERREQQKQMQKQMKERGND